MSNKNRWAFACIMCVIFSAEVRAEECSRFIQPPLVSYDEFFNDKPFGSIAIPYTRNRLAYIDGRKCYNVYSFIHRDAIRFVVNNKRGGAPSPHYLSAVVVKSYDYAMSGVGQPISVSYHRNKGDESALGDWAKINAEHSAPRYLQVSQVVAAEEYNSRVNITVDSTAEFGKVLQYNPSDSHTKEWHAWIINLDVAGDQGVPVFWDTRENITRIGLSGISLDISSFTTNLVRLHLKKFAGSESPTVTPSDIPDIFDIRHVSDASCIYVRYAVDGSVEPVLGSGPLPSDYFVLSSTGQTNC